MSGCSRSTDTVASPPLRPSARRPWATIPSATAREPATAPSRAGRGRRPSGSLPGMTARRSGRWRWPWSRPPWWWCCSPPGQVDRSADVPNGTDPRWSAPRRTPPSVDARQRGRCCRKPGGRCPQLPVLGADRRVRLNCALAVVVVWLFLRFVLLQRPARSLRRDRQQCSPAVTEPGRRTRRPPARLRPSRRRCSPTPDAQREELQADGSPATPSSPAGTGSRPGRRGWLAPPAVETSHGVHDARPGPRRRLPARGLRFGDSTGRPFSRARADRARNCAEAAAAWTPSTARSALRSERRRDRRSLVVAAC